MKKILMAFVAATCMFSSCSDDNTTGDNASQHTIAISSEVLEAGPEGHVSEVTVTSSGDWRISGVCDWAHPSVVSGKDGQKVTLTIDPNDTDTSRETTFKFFTGSAVTALKIVSEPDYTMELLSDAEMTFSSAENKFMVKLHTNVPELTYAFSDGGEEWVALERRSDAFDSTMLYFDIAENTDYDARTTVMTISGKGLSVAVTVGQNQMDAIVPDKTAYEVDATGGTLTVGLGANIAYTVEIPDKYASWIHYVPKSDATRGLVSHTETFTLDPASDLRAGKINFKAADGSFAMSVTVRQGTATNVFATIPDAQFRAWLLDKDYALEIEGAKCELTQAGINATSFGCSYLEIKSFEGIEAFTKLTTLECAGNPLERIPLKDLNITSLDMSRSWTMGADIVISGSKLKSVNCYYIYSLKSLDLSDCPVLDTLDIKQCYYFTTLYLKTGQTIANISDSSAGSYAPGGKYAVVYK